jgi:hypothetical protein
MSLIGGQHVQRTGAGLTRMKTPHTVEIYAITGGEVI